MKNDGKFSFMGSPEFSPAQWKIVGIGFVASSFLAPLMPKFMIGHLPGPFLIGLLVTSTSLVYAQSMERAEEMSNADKVQLVLSALSRLMATVIFVLVITHLAH